MRRFGRNWPLNDRLKTKMRSRWIWIVWKHFTIGQMDFIFDLKRKSGTFLWVNQFYLKNHKLFVNFKHFHCRGITQFKITVLNSQYFVLFPMLFSLLPTSILRICLWNQCPVLLVFDFRKANNTFLNPFNTYRLVDRYNFAGFGNAEIKVESCILA